MWGNTDRNNLNFDGCFSVILKESSQNLVIGSIEEAFFYCDSPEFARVQILLWADEEVIVLRTDPKLDGSQIC